MKLCHLTYTTLVPSILEHGLVGMPSRHHRYDGETIQAVRWSGDLPERQRPPAVWFMSRQDAELYVHNDWFRHRHDPAGDVRQIVEVDLTGYEVVAARTPFFDLHNVKIFAVFTARIPPDRITVVPRGEPRSFSNQLMRLGARVLR